MPIISNSFKGVCVPKLYRDVSFFFKSCSISVHGQKQSSAKVSFLLFSLSIYMSESNMLIEKTQPIFGLIGVAFISFFLLQSRSWLSFIFFIVGIMLISCGSLLDFAHENESIRSLLPASIFHFLHNTSWVYLLLHSNKIKRI